MAVAHKGCISMGLVLILIGMYRATVDKVCVVEYMSNLKNALRQPVFKGFRDDVSAEDL